MKVQIVLLILGCSLALAQASLSADISDSTNDLLPNEDAAKDKILDLDDEDEEASGDLLYDNDDDYEDDDDYDYDDEDEDEEYYDDDDEDDDDWSLYDEAASGDDDLKEDDDDEEYDDIDADVDKKDSDWHFADGNDDSSSGKKLTDEAADILYEYYAEEYEEDYDMSDSTPSQPEVPVVKVGHDDDTVSSKEKLPPTFLKSDNLLVSVFVASGLVSFALFTLAFVLCYWHRRSGAAKAGANLPFVIDVGDTFSHGGGAGVRGHSVPPSSIVKNYQRVPTSTKEFLSSNGMENSSHVLHQNSGQLDNSEKPLLP